MHLDRLLSRTQNIRNTISFRLWSIGEPQKTAEIIMQYFDSAH